METKTRAAVSIPASRRIAARPRLIVMKGGEVGRFVELEGQAVGIGRGGEVDFHVDSDLVSRRHATVYRLDGRSIVEDLGSTNGTKVNGERVQRAELADGDLIKVGPLVLRYAESELEVSYHDNLVAQSRVDALTGAANKRAFDEDLASLLTRNDKIGRPLGLLVLDVDHFKSINDGFGHAGGDEVLKRVVQVIDEALLSGERLYRVGGEEFAVVLAAGTLSVARERGEAVRCAIERNDVDFEGRVIPVTVSIGASSSEPGDSPELIYRRADEQLYAAKRTGRNRVC